jgi:hypothetical protein
MAVPASSTAARRITQADPGGIPGAVLAQGNEEDVRKQRKLHLREEERHRRVAQTAAENRQREERQPHIAQEEVETQKREQQMEERRQKVLTDRAQKKTAERAEQLAKLRQDRQARLARMRRAREEEEEEPDGQQTEPDLNDSLIEFGRSDQPEWVRIAQGRSLEAMPVAVEHHASGITPAEVIRDERRERLRAAHENKMRGRCGSIQPVTHSCKEELDVVPQLGLQNRVSLYRQQRLEALQNRLKVAGDLPRKSSHLVRDDVVEMLNDAYELPTFIDGEADTGFEVPSGDEVFWVRGTEVRLPDGQSREERIQSLRGVLEKEVGKTKLATLFNEIRSCEQSGHVSTPVYDSLDSGVITLAMRLFVLQYSPSLQ